MIRLILLLLGSKPLRAYWWIFIVASALSLLVSLIFIKHLSLFDSEIIVTTDIIGIGFVILGMARLISLAAIGFANATISVLKSLAFFALGFMAIDIPWDDNIVATIVIGAALVLDGVFRIGSALLVISPRWRQSVAIAMLEFVVAALVWAPWPVPHRDTVPFCIGVALIAASGTLFQLGLQLRRLRPGASVTDLPLFAGPNWHARSILHPLHTEDESWENDEPLRVHIWTAVGAATHPQRLPVIDRYIAAVDQNGVISTGHAALSLPPDIYVSLCPADDSDHSTKEFRLLLRSGVENDVPGCFKPSLLAECAEWRPPDREVLFHRYNGTALRAFLDIYRRKQIYNLTSRNCSSTVALSLDAAVEGVLGSSPVLQTLLRLFTDPAMWLLSLWRARAETMTWTPGLMLDYAQSLQHVLEHVLEGRHEGWFARLRNMRHHYETGRRALTAEGHPTKSNIPAMASVVVTATIFGLTYGLSAPLLALSLTQLGFDKSFIGANAAMHAVGVLAVAPFLPNLAWRLGPKLPITVALLIAAATLAMFPVMPFIWLWFPLRIALGAASETLFVMSETWLSQLSSENSRARTMAVYTACVSLGYALGPAILAVVGPKGLLPYLIGGGIALLALIAVAMPWVRAPSFERPSHGNPLHYLSLAPVAIAATLVNAALETAGMSFLPLYALRSGWSEGPATLLLSVLLVGAILLQLPIGWLGDRMDWRKLVIGLGLASTAGALVWPFVINSPFIAYPLLFVWGGLFVGIYTIMMAVVGSKFQGGDLVSIYALMSIAWGAGAFIGPSSAGTAMDLTRHGLPIFATIACAAFTGVAVVFRRRS